ncbi:MAG: hypothetical protein ISS35_00070 [Kiritimatiellae bacterium]|nr:hypothetical protein [Kiritimatiellia bacterium]
MKDRAMKRISISILCIACVGVACQRDVKQEVPRQAHPEPHTSPPAATSVSEAQPAEPTPVAPHDWESPLEENLAHLQSLLQSESSWRETGTDRKLSRNCTIYRHATEPLTVWIDEQIGVALRAEADTGFVCALKSIKKHDDGTWFVRRVELKQYATREKVELDFTLENSPTLTTAWRATN